MPLRLYSISKGQLAVHLKKLSAAGFLAALAAATTLPALLHGGGLFYGPTNPVSLFQEGKANLLQVAHERDGRKQLALLCEALSLFEAASRRSPAEARYQIAYADLLMELSSAPDICEAPRIRNPDEILTHALRLAPFSVVDKYLAAVSYVRKGDKQKALSLLKEAQELSPPTAAVQRDYAYRLVQTEDDLRAALPETYPLAAVWVQHFYQMRREDFETWKPVFADAVSKAAADLEVRAADGRGLSPEDKLRAVRGLWLLPLNASFDDLRRRLDESYAKLLNAQGQHEAASLLTRRAALARIPILKSAVQDKMPASGMLSGWLPDYSSTTAALGGVSRSIGYFVPDGFRPDLIVLESRLGSEPIDPAQLELFVSEDNLSYRRFAAAQTIKSVRLEGKQMVVVPLSGSEGPYVKVRLSLVGKRSLPSDTFDLLIQAYGVQL